MVLHVYFQALLRWGLWEELVSDHGGQFISHDFARIYKRLGIHHDMYPKGHPWQNLIESYFGIEARLGEYQWERCKTIEEAQEFHRELIRDYNRLPHWAHHLRQDGRRSPLAVLGDAKGKQIEPADLERAFGQRYSQRMTDARGFVRIGRWKIYIEEALPRTPIQHRHGGASDHRRVEQLDHLLDALSVERKGVIVMKRSRLNAIVHVSLILALLVCGCEPLSRAKGGAVAPGAELKDLKNLEELQKLFNQDKGALRLILLLSPT